MASPVDTLGGLTITVDTIETTRFERETSSGFTRASTVVSLAGDGAVGRGEDVTYDPAAHDAFPIPELSGTATLADFSARLSKRDLFDGDDPDQPIYRNYRQWAFESAALDLALKQAETNLGTVLDRSYDPVRFVVSTRLADPPTGDRVFDWLERNPDLEFKLDPTSDWTDDLVERLAATDAVQVLDLKGQYHGTEVDQPADPALYRRVLEGFPDALIEDPALTDDTRELFVGHEHRVTWDYPIRGIDTIEDLPWEPTWLNIKPSRFGTIESLVETLAYCERNDIQCFGGGQFELDVGREHLHTLASLFYPAAPNDVAPSGYNDPDPRNDLPTSPLHPPSHPRGMAWR